MIASICAGRKPSTSSSGMARTLPLQVAVSGSVSASRRVRARVSGRGNAKIRRARGSGSYPLVTWVSDPDASTMNGSRPSTVNARRRTSAGSPSAYLADCHSTPESGVPTGFASMTPTARLHHSGDVVCKRYPAMPLTPSVTGLSRAGAWDGFVTACTVASTPNADPRVRGHSCCRGG